MVEFLWWKFLHVMSEKNCQTIVTQDVSLAPLQLLVITALNRLKRSCTMALSHWNVVTVKQHTWYFGPQPRVLLITSVLFLLRDVKKSPNKLTTWCMIISSAGHRYSDWKEACFSTVVTTYSKWMFPLIELAWQVLIHVSYLSYRDPLGQQEEMD